MVAEIAVAMPFLCLGTLLGGTVIYTILTAYKLPPAGELPRIFKNIITMVRSHAAFRPSFVTAF